MLCNDTVLTEVIMLCWMRAYNIITRIQLRKFMDFFAQNNSGVQH